jgi:hypothetical protein
LEQFLDGFWPSLYAVLAGFTAVHSPAVVDHRD